VPIAKVPDLLTERNPSPLLRGDRVSLVPFGSAHLTAEYVGWLNDPEVTEYSELRHRRHTLEECVAYANATVATGNFFWAIETLADPPLHVGNITAYVDLPNLVADVAIMIGSARVRGRGIGAAAWCLACDWLLEDGSMRKVIAGTMASNEPMRGLMRKSGMIEEAVRPSHFLLDGAVEDVVLAGRFRDE
jgi:[ribosomal protein S5]-alanine N-acetyltransferase